MTATEMPLTDADRAKLDAWAEACEADPQRLPVGVLPVQTRLVRSVGRGELPDGGPVYLKLMGFPRPRDRVRYVHRALPAQHEARMLARVAELGIACPEVVDVRTARRSGRLPRMSLLVTRALDAVDSGDTVGQGSEQAAVSIAEAVSIATQLAEHGLFHPDLNQGNFVRLRDGGVALLDLQSVRKRGVPLGAGLRRAMATKMVHEFGVPDRLEVLIDLLVPSGLVPSSDVEGVAVAAGKLARAETLRRVRRCLTTSTEFVASRRWNGQLFRRRIVEQLGEPVSHESAKELWLGDRVLEVLDGESPVLGAMFRKSWWFPGLDHLYISASDRTSVSVEAESRLLTGFSRLQSIERA